MEREGYGGFRIRLRLSGLVAFISSVTSTFTGFLTIILVTRNISLYEYGLWYLFSQYVSLASTVLLGVINFWALRYIARGYPVAKTAVFSAGVFASISAVMYTLLVVWASRAFNQPLLILLLGIPQVFIFYIVTVLMALLRGYAPHFYGVAQLIFEFSKVAFVYIAVAVVRRGLFGVIIAVMAAYIAQAIFSVFALYRPLKRSRVDFKKFVQWIKLAWIPLYRNLHHFLLNLEPLVVRALQYSEEAIGIRSMSVTLGFIVSHASSLGVALYPKVLQSRGAPSGADVEVTLKLEYMLAIPLAVGVAVLAPEILLLFGKNYLGSLYGTWVAIACFLVVILGTTLDQVIMGAETIDLNEGISMRAYAKSLICKDITLNVGRAATGIATLVILLLALKPGSNSLVAVIWNLAWLVTLIPFQAYKYAIARKLSAFRFPVRSVVKYAFASALMAISLKVLMAMLGPPSSTRITYLAGYLAILVAPPAVLYFLVVWAIDPFARGLVRAALNTARGFMLRGG